MICANDLFFSGWQHPIHLHLVHFQVAGRYPINYDSNTDDEGFCGNPATDPLKGVCLEIKQEPTGEIGFKALFPATRDLAYGSAVQLDARYSAEIGGPKDVVTALPGQVTKIRVKFDKRGKYVWHCHILSHEDHEMMRKFEVV
jgi:spore coat protein A